MKTHAILLAGGSSHRFTDEENKVYFPIGRKPALCWPLETLEKSEDVDSILLVIREEDWEKTNRVIELVDTEKLVGVTVGGKTRHDSEYEGLMYLKNSGNVSEDDLILIQGSVPGSKNGVVLLRDAIKHKAPNEVPFPAGFRNDSKAKNEDLSLSSSKNEKEISSESDGAEGEN